MPGLRCLAISSDTASLAELAFALDTDPAVSAFTAVSDLESALALMHSAAVDAIFVYLEEMSAQQLEELRIAPWQPALVAVADDPALAATAFDFGAVDFLRKPFNRSRVSRAVERLNKCSCCRTPQHVSYRIAIQRGEQLCFVDARDIEFVEADGDYTRVHSAAGVDNCRQTLNALAERLTPLGFVRIHRKWLVSTARVQAVVTRDGQLAVQVGGQELPVARRVAADVRSRFQ